MKRIAIAVVRHGEMFLVGKRSVSVSLAGLCEFPGGKVEPGESFVAAAIRETREETGVDVQNGHLLMDKNHTYPDGELHLQFFEFCLPADRSLLVPKSPFRWVQRSELGSLPFPDANREVIQRLLD